MYEKFTVYMKYFSAVLMSKIQVMLLLMLAYGHGNVTNENSEKPKHYEGRYTRQIADYEVVVPHRAHENGSFLSYQLPHYYERAVSRHKRSASKGPPHVHYIVPFGGRHYHVELWPNHVLMDPNLVVERRASRIRDTKIQRVPDQQCHYTGEVRDVHGSRAALSVCDGLAGYVKLDVDYIYIEPALSAVPGSDGQHLHLAYRPSEKPAGSCRTDDDWMSAWERRLRWEAAKNASFWKRHMDAPRSVSKRRYLQTGVIADKKFVQYHKIHDIENYILTIMNMVSGFYHDWSVGNFVDVVVVRIMYLEKEEEEMDLTINPNAENTLASFCKWQMGINPADQNHPNHHDIAVLVTRYDICSDNETNCNLMGLAYVATACRPDQACCINEDSGLLLGVVIAHEMGHVMGCSHDEVNISGCPPQAEDESYYVMSPFVKLRTTRWSNCSKNYITTFLDNALGECLLDEPKDQNFKEPTMPPGAMYDAAYQCHEAYGDVGVCPTKDDRFCERLFCKTSEDGCSSKGEPAADGTTCGENMWCYDQKCVDIGKRPGSVNGDWGEWGPWGDCSRSCGGGVQWMARECDNPKPENKGRYCLGERKRYRTCNTWNCDVNAPTFREEQCSSYNNKPFQNKLSTWKPFYVHDKKANPCELACVNEANVYSVLSPRVKDGTKCRLGSKDLCIAGDCKHVGCDWTIDSDAVEDACGICRGDGTNCKLIEGTFSEPGGIDYVNITKIPKESHNIKLVELQPSENTLAVSSVNGTFFLNGDHQEQKDGEYMFGPNVVGVYTHTEPEKEELVIMGPTVEDLVVYLVFFGEKNPGVKYSYYERTSGSAYEPHYDWEFLDWSECTARCGSGSQVSQPLCVESKSGRVSQSFCSQVPKPEAKVRSCNQKACVTSWRVAEWGSCPGCFFRSGLQRRKVDCVRQNPQMDGEDIVCDASACKSPMPVLARFCNKAMKCREIHRIINRVPHLSFNKQLGFGRWQSKTKSQPSSGGVGGGPRPETNLVRSRPVLDSMPPSQILLYHLPLTKGNQSMKLSETAKERLGDRLSARIDTPNQVVYTGEEAVKRVKEIKQKHNDTQS